MSETQPATPGPAASRWVKIWDAPTRLFHWALVVLVVSAVATAKLGLIDWHFRVGYTILALVLFRIVWGLVGSETARFSSFVKGPGAVLAYFSGMFRRAPDTQAGHNPAGGLMVLVLLGLLSFQVGTGLFSNDGVFSEGPLAQFIDPDLSERITGWHETSFKLILAAVALHVVAVFFYAIVKRQDLVRPMVTGWKRLPASIPAPRPAHVALAAGAFAAAVAVAVGVSSLG